LDFFAATSSSKGVGDNGGVIGMSSSETCCGLVSLDPDWALSLDAAENAR
jgi:hypothetical protein